MRQGYYDIQDFEVAEEVVQRGGSLQEALVRLRNEQIITHLTMSAGFLRVVGSKNSDSSASIAFDVLADLLGMLRQERESDPERFVDCLVE
jgi:hypothetical protein